MELASRQTNSAFPTMISGDIGQEAVQSSGYAKTTGRKTVGTPFCG